MKRHLKRNHSGISTEYEQRLNEKKRKKVDDEKQPKIAEYMKESPVMELAVDMVVENAVSFELFVSSSMRSLTNHAKKGFNDKSSRAINDETVKLAVIERAKKKREEIKKLLAGKIINLSADFATCWSRSFFGEHITTMFFCLII